MKKIQIHKKNELIRGTDNLSVYAKRLLNTIYYIVQKNELYEQKYFIIEARQLKKFLGLKNVKDYTNIIRKTLNELQEKKIELYNYYDPLEKKLFKWLPIHFLQYPTGEYEDKKSGIIKFQIALNPLILHLMKIKKNFTKLDLIPYTLKFRSKYNYKLYEFLKSFQNYNYIRISLKHLNKLLNTNKKYPSKMLELLKRNIKELKEKTDLKNLEVEYIKEEKYFKIYINKKSKKTPPTNAIINDIIKKTIKKF